LSRIHSLDSLRGISALIVLIHHIFLMTPIFYAAHYSIEYKGWLDEVFNIPFVHTIWAGSEAVILFFVLSGFVLALPFLNSSNFHYKSYIIQRFSRIYLPYFVIMIIAVLLMVTIADYNGHSGMIPSFSERRWSHPLSLEAAFSYIFMLGYDNTNVNGPTWSLVHEMRISFIFPIIMMLIIKNGAFKSSVIGFAVSMIASVILLMISRVIENNFIATIVDSFGDTAFYTTFFLIGATFAKYYHLIEAPFKRLKLSNKIGLFILAILLFNFNETFPFLKRDYGFINQGINFIDGWFTAAGVLIIFTFAIFSPTVSKILEKPSLIWLGKISYSLYLIHMVVLITLAYTIGKMIPVEYILIMVPIVSLPAAWLLNKYVEKPSAKLGKLLTGKTKKTVVYQKNAS
jgi:peptidoglycan/LPS O-acetylase OafA/YrhL